MKKIKAKWINDPSHGWLKVSLKTVIQVLNETDCKISTCSYLDQKYAYLEEDCDSQRFIFYASKLGIEVLATESYTYTHGIAPLRNLPKFPKMIEETEIVD